MNKYSTISIFFFLLFCGQCYAQSVWRDSDDSARYQDFPHESIFVHSNTRLLFVGEYFYYSLYCLDSKSKRPSKISKIAYVEVIGEEGNVVFKHKLRLEEGRSYGDFFMPTSVSSGNYKLIGYTQWMKNLGTDYFFQSDITIINPYQGNQNSLLETNKGEDTSIRIPRAKMKPEKRDGFKDYNYGNLELKISRKKFKSRDKVSFTIKNKFDLPSDNYFSISVRKIDTMQAPVKHTSRTFIRHHFKKSKNSIKSLNDSIYLPELRGELISGKIIDRNTSKPEKDIDISISVPGKEYQLKMANSNDNGLFYFNIDQSYTVDKAIVQVLHKKPESYGLLIKKQENIDYSGFTFHQFKLLPSMKDMILERSFHNQIENAFFSVKPDTVKTIKTDLPFYRNNPLVYDLDDYTRFSTLKETVVEIIKHVWISKDELGNSIFQVRGNPPYYESPYPPLVLIDGILVRDQHNLMDYNAKKIKRILLGRDRYIMGKKIHHGVIDIETIRTDYNIAANGMSIKEVELFRPVPKKKYFRQAYTDSTYAKTVRIPDFRYQLLWLPDLKLEARKKEIVFYTSDVKGNFEIYLEGFTASGEPTSIREVISVE
ncbi:MAG: hypothetical protein WBG90_01715 [Saonia sp.]